MHRIRLFSGFSTLILYATGFILHGYVKALLWRFSGERWVSTDAGRTREESLARSGCGVRRSQVWSGFVYRFRSSLRFQWQTTVEGFATRGTDVLRDPVNTLWRLYRGRQAKRRLATPVVDHRFRKLQVLRGPVFFPVCANGSSGLSPDRRRRREIQACVTWRAGCHRLLWS